MSAIHAVLLIPHEGDPHELLAEGPCGARPPMAWVDGTQWHPAIGTPDCYEGETLALVLAWGGEVVPQGALPVDIAASTREGWYIEPLAWLVAQMLRGTVYEGCDGEPDTTALDGLRGDVEPFGTVLVLDADGVEVSP